MKTQGVKFRDNITTIVYAFIRPVIGNPGLATIITIYSYFTNPKL